MICLVVITPNTVRLRLAEEEKQAKARGEKILRHSDITASNFILQGIEHEDAQ